MNGARDANATLVHDITFESKRFPGIDIVVCPPAVYIESIAAALSGSSVQLGGQTLSEQQKLGAFTGEIQGGMLKDVDRKSTRLNSVTNAHLVCRLLLEKKKPHTLSHL